MDHVKIKQHSPAQIFFPNSKSLVRKFVYFNFSALNSSLSKKYPSDGCCSSNKIRIWKLCIPEIRTNSGSQQYKIRLDTLRKRWTRLGGLTVYTVSRSHSLPCQRSSGPFFQAHVNCTAAVADMSWWSAPHIYVPLCCINKSQN